MSFKIKKNKITFILPHLNGGGAERVCLTYLRKLKNNKFDISLIVFDKTTDLTNLIPEDVELINLDTKRVSKSLFQLIKVLRNNKTDYVFTTHYTVAFLISIVKLFTPRFTHLARIPGSPKSEKKHNYYGSINRCLFGIGLRSAQINIAQTSEMLEEAIEVFKLNPKDCIILSNPIDTLLIDESIKEDFLLFNSEKFNIVASGRLHPVKGYDILIKAFSEFNKIQQNNHLYILGSDKGSESELKDLVKQLKLEKNVSFLGFINNPYPYYLNCDLFVLSSIHEGFPNAVLENHYLNTPIVSTRCANIVKRLITNGVNGFLCETNNIKDLMENMEKASILKRCEIKNEKYMGSDLNTLLTQIQNA